MSRYPNTISSFDILSVEGNMNSDNMMLAGRTLDYGPFGWMER
jgi:uncharacterized protein YdiU (UPF0061 family)